MTSERFDELTKTLSKAASRRTLFKGALAAAVSGTLARFGGGGAAEAANRQACRRLHQSCGPGQTCCVHLACQNGDCCRPLNETCYADSDCCPDNVCRPNPHGLGQRCLPPGLVGAECIDASDCAGGLGCDAYTGTCQNSCDGVTCTADQACCGDAYSLSQICCGGVGQACDTTFDECVSCSEYGEGCFNDDECCDNLRTGNAVCGEIGLDNALPAYGGGICCVPLGGSCAVGPCCGGGICDVGNICRGIDGLGCTDDDQCLSGYCDPMFQICCDPYRGCIS